MSLISFCFIFPPEIINLGHYSETLVSEYTNENSFKWLGFWEQTYFFLNKALGLQECRKAKQNNLFKIVSCFLNLLRAKHISNSFAFFPEKFVDHIFVSGFCLGNMLISYNTVSHLSTEYLLFQGKKKKWNQTETFSGAVISVSVENRAKPNH